jgi:TetR/AcrR family transcriptional regulator, cholesterol catabolism regulator
MLAKRKKNLTSEEKMNTKLAQIYDVAATLICQKGFDATSVSDIAEAMNLTKAGLYHYIEGKQNLLYKIMSFALEALAEDVIEPARNEPDPVKRLELIIRNHTLAITRGSSPMTILIDEMAGLSREQHEEVLEHKIEYFLLVRDTLTELQKAEKLNDLNPSIAAHNLIGIILHLSRWYRRNGKMKDEEIVDEMLKIVHGGFLRS